MIVKISGKHIQEGVRENCLKCPSALAIIEHLQANNKNVKFIVTVGHTQATVILDYESVMIYDHNGIQFILNFDKGCEVKPTELELRLQNVLDIDIAHLETGLRNMIEEGRKQDESKRG